MVNSGLKGLIRHNFKLVEIKITRDYRCGDAGNNSHLEVKTITRNTEY